MNDLLKGAFTLVNKRKLAVFFGTLVSSLGALATDLIGEATFAQIIEPLSYAFFAGNFGEHATNAFKARQADADK